MKKYNKQKISRTDFPMDTYLWLYWWKKLQAELVFILSFRTMAPG